MLKSETTQLNELNVYFTLKFYVEAREGRYYDLNSKQAHRNPKTKQMEYDNCVRSYISEIVENAHRLPSEWLEVINNNNVNYIELAYILLKEIDIKERL
ncbi:hypothetical protein [Staphylococcus shinii]|uniref:hypothetical protein n=1 Tax=Staphylococcus shinii TaxID=2912228 RepID=UPI003EEDF787